MSSQCIGCSEEVEAGKYLTCSACNKCCCNFCGNITLQLIENAPPDWLCPDCSSKKPKGDNTNTPIRGIMAQNITLRNKGKTSAQPQPQQCKNCINRLELQELVQTEIKNAIEKSVKAALNTCFNESLKDIQLQLENFTKSINFINDQFEMFKTAVSKNSETVKKISNEHEVLQSQLNELSVRFSILEQTARESNIELNGLPENKTENLMNTTLQLGTVVGHPLMESDILHCHRVAQLNRDRNTERPRSVVVKLKSTLCRDSLLASINKYNRSKAKPSDKLNTGDLGIGGRKCPVFVQEHLTSANKKLHAEVRKKAKESNYKFVWVRNGRIFARKDESHPFILIRNQETLKLMV